MAANVAEVAMVAGLVVVGCLLTYFCSRQFFKRANAETQRRTQAELKILQQSIETFGARIDELSKHATAPVIVPLAAEAGSFPEEQQRKVIPFPRKEDVPPEIVVMIAAAVTTFLGKRVRIRSAKRLQSPSEIVNPWAQQGRVIVQASHNLLPGSRSERSPTRGSQHCEAANWD